MSYAVKVRELKKVLEDYPNIPRSLIRDHHSYFLQVEIMHLVSSIWKETDVAIQALVEAQRTMDIAEYDPEKMENAQIANGVSSVINYASTLTIEVYKECIKMINTDDFLQFFNTYESPSIERAIEDFTLDGHPASIDYTNARLKLF